MDSRYSVAWLCVKERIGNTELAVGTKFQQSLSIFVQFAYAKVPKAIRLGIVISPYFSVEISKQKQLFRIWYLVNNSIKLIFVLCGRA